MGFIVTAKHTYLEWQSRAMPETQFSRTSVIKTTVCATSSTAAFPSFISLLRINIGG
jgi:hypothetical protein